MISYRLSNTLAGEDWTIDLLERFRGGMFSVRHREVSAQELQIENWTFATEELAYAFAEPHFARFANQ